jgi:hypothetical protein
MKRAFIFLFAVVAISLTVSAASQFDIKQLQGAWWSNKENPTADFGIRGEEVWLDFDSGYHPCRIDGDVLIFDLGADRGLVKNRIVSIKGDVMVLEDVSSKQRVTLTRVKD